MSELIEAKVAQILSDNCIVINVGALDGAKVGMIFVVLAQGEEVKDPESGEVLGQWEVPKGYIRAAHVQERLCTCEGHVPGRETRQEDSSTQVLSAAMITHSMRPESWRGGGVSLRVNRAQVSGMPAISPISVGDTVREMRLESPPQEQPKTTTEQPTTKPDDKAPSP